MMRDLKICVHLLFLLSTACRKVSCQRRIVGGSDAADGMFPYAALIVINDGKGTCTGSLLSESWVLTAAHCIPTGPGRLEVMAGAADRRSPNAQVRYSNEFKVHSKYIKNKLAAYDLALIKVEKPFNMSSPYIGNVSLSTTEWSEPSVQCTALGWGRISTSGRIPDLLQHVNVMASHGSNGCPCAPRFAQKKLVCLEGTSGRGPCWGDSGGPLICGGKEVGVTHVGFTLNGCNPVYPEVPKMFCAKEDTIVSYIYICPELNWIRQYVPSVPPTPLSCSAIDNRPRMFGILMFVISAFFLCYIVTLNLYNVYCLSMYPI